MYDVRSSFEHWTVDTHTHTHTGHNHFVRLILLIISEDNSEFPAFQLTRLSFDVRF